MKAFNGTTWPILFDYVRFNSNESISLINASQLILNRLSTVNEEYLGPSLCQLALSGWVINMLPSDQFISDKPTKVRKYHPKTQFRKVIFPYSMNFKRWRIGKLVYLNE
jgi:hypothetical protein